MSISGHIVPSTVERRLQEDELIVSKTDQNGLITYANKKFIDMAFYTEKELLGKPHSIVRHPDMPRCVFKFLWDSIKMGQEVFAYVKNMAKDGAFYWVFAHVTPTYDLNGNIIGFHSNRRAPKFDKVPVVESLYASLLSIEHGSNTSMEGMKESYEKLVSTLESMGVSCNEFFLSL